MTDFLVRVRTAAEVALAARAGADIVEYLVFDGGPDDLACVQAIRAAWPGRLRLRFREAGSATQASSAAALADECALPLDAIVGKPIVGSTLVGLLPASRAIANEARLARLSSRPAAIMLVVEHGMSIFTAVDIASLDALANRCSVGGVAFEIGGHIEAPDVARLLLLSPRVLAFDETVRSGPDEELDPGALETMRALIPPSGANGHPAATQSGTTVDRIFVRDFVVETSIGAYRAEHRGDQRVRFDVEVDVARVPVPPRDMRDVFSYDIVIETIRVLARRGHVLFVETLAEELAGRILAYPAVMSTTVRVSKLDVIDGVVGIEIRRDRQVR